MKTMVPKASKARYMSFNLLKYQRAQAQFKFLWRRGHENQSDYHTKHHPPKNHVKMRGYYVVDVVPQ